LLGIRSLELGIQCEGLVSRLCLYSHCFPSSKLFVEDDENEEAMAVGT